MISSLNKNIGTIEFNKITLPGNGIVKASLLTLIQVLKIDINIEYKNDFALNTEKSEENLHIQSRINYASVF